MARSTSILRAQRSLRRGFSLLELVVVVLLVATISAVAVPRYGRSLERYRADAAARRVVADLTYARTQARLVGQSRSVEFDVPKSAYTIAGVRGLRDDGGTYEVVLADEPYSCAILSVALGDPSDVTDDPSIVVFNGFGVPDGGGTVAVQSGDLIRTVVVDPDTGEAALQ